MIDLTQNQHCVIRDCSEYVFVPVKYFELVCMDSQKISCADSQVSSALGKVTLVQGSVVAATAHKAECRLCDHECDGDQPAHEQSHNLGARA